MGTRADFWIRKEKGKQLDQNDWIGSIAFDGYPFGIPESIKKATTKQGFKKAVIAFMKKRDDATFPEMGWPWPWNGSHTTDYAYVFSGNSVNWQDSYPSKKKWPVMDTEKSTLGKRSGLIVIRSNH